MGKKALIAMSGGVDSSVAAYLLREQGFECIGVTFKLFGNEDIGVDREQACCSQRDVEDARGVAHALGIPHYVLNFSQHFKTQVIDRFISAYQSGATPNPCIDCNRYLKFDKLLQKADELDVGYVATGHYARAGGVGFDGGVGFSGGGFGGGGRFFLKKGLDESKDQSYVLYPLTQRQLGRVIFPLGGLKKGDIRAIAAAQGFINAAKRDSQDICFVPDGDYAGFIEMRQRSCAGAECGECAGAGCGTGAGFSAGAGFKPGDFVDLQGNALGRHRGYIRYTIGQRKGLGLSLPRPMYVHSKDVKSNTVTLCENGGLFSDSLEAADFNWIAMPEGPGKADTPLPPPPNAPIRCAAKVRYKHAEAPATATVTESGTVLVVFDEPQRAIAKGQAVVLYAGDYVLGGGTIL